jgi:ADP-L-glycero-D-manno-heptose 6-epimerase
VIVVTGGAGFIGSNLVTGLNQSDYHDVIVVDDLTQGKKFSNLVGSTLQDYWDQEEFFSRLEKLKIKPQAIFHLGACSTTTNWDGKYMMENNYDYSCRVLDFCLEHGVTLIYASSAAVYGNHRQFEVHKDNEKPINVYAYSKFLFDERVRRHLGKSSAPIVGMRYFNVYGPNEAHKGSMASVAYHCHQQLLETDTVRLFEGTDGYGHGEQLRDFVYVGDTVKVKLWMLAHPEVSGIFNVGTGRAQTFNEVAEAVIAWHQRGEIQYIPFPAHLKGCYQSYTQADIQPLRRVGYDASFKTVEEGVRAYLDQLASGA